MSDSIYDQQKQIIETIQANYKLNPGEDGYVIPMHWLRKWKNYVGFSGKKTDDDQPGRIDNTLLTNSQHSVDPKYQYGRDYDVITKIEWDTYVQWYGGSPEIKLEIAFDPIKKKNIPVLKLHLFIIFYDDRAEDLHISNYRSVKDVLEKATELFNLEKNKFHIRKYINKERGETLEEEKIICEYSLKYGSMLLLESNDIPRDMDIVKSSSMPSMQAFSGELSKKSFSTTDLNAYDITESKYPGLIGITNIGNTCYMATVLQCLLHIQHFKDLICSKVWLEPPIDNKDGEVFKTFTELYKQIWEPKESTASPYDLKTALEKHYPQFVGRDPHDSHEFLTCLLRHLHEEKIKPTRRQSFAINVAYDAEASWDAIKKTENSCFVDTFFGMTRHTLRCPNCGKVQDTFEPFLSLSIPMPARNVVTVSFVFVPRKHEEPMRTMKLKLFDDASDLEFAESLSLELKRKIDVAFAEIEDKTEKKIATWIPKFRTPKKNTEIYVFEIDSRDNLYAAVWLCLKLQRGIKKTKTEIGVPYLIKLDQGIDTTLESIKQSCEQSFSYLFDGSVKSPSTLHPDIKKLRDKVVRFNKDADIQLKIKVEKSMRSKTMKFKSIEGIPYISKRNVYAIINGYMLKDKDFNWSLLRRQLRQIATMPVNRAVIPMVSCLNGLIQEQILDSSNGWMCSDCKKLVPAIAKTSINRLPPILILHLKRFFIDIRRCTKNDTFVKYDFDLDLSDYVEEHLKENSKYKLVSVGEHAGTLTGGHYEAKVLQNGKWYNFSDNSVRECSIDQVVNANGYLLYYVRE